MFFDPEIDIVSTAVFESEASSWRALLAVSYAMFEPRDFFREEAAFLNALDAQRAEVALPAVVRVQGPNDKAVLSESAERIRLGQTSPLDERDALLDHFAKATGRTFYGTVFSPMQIDGWTPSSRPRCSSTNTWPSRRASPTSNPKANLGANMLCC